MKIAMTLIFAVLLSSTTSLPAQEKSVAGSKVPNPAAFTDLLKEVKPSGPKAVNPSSSAARPRPIERKSDPAPKAANVVSEEDAREIERVLAEARMHLARIREESTEEAARNVFDEIRAFITARLANLEEKSSKKETASKVSTGKIASSGTGKSTDDVEQPSQVEAESVLEVFPEERPASEKVATPSQNWRLRWAEKLRALADELEAEAISSDSEGD